MRIARRTILLLALALLLAAGCGSGGGSPGRDQSPADDSATTQKGGGYDYP